MNHFLSPEKNNKLLKSYHFSGKMLIPLLFSSYVINNLECEKTKSIINSFTISNISFHSYVSTSCIITDYIKPQNISKIVRCTSLGGHFLATSGYIYYLFKNFKNK